METLGKWYSELVTPDLLMQYRIRNIAYTGKTRYQAVDILDTETLGRCLVLDGKTQSCEVDEHIYHECLVHPALISQDRARTVFIGGGGEGATLREVLRHKSIERAVMVDLDKEVIELCRRFLPQHHRGSFDDPRVELRHEDARQYLASGDERFDMIILDLVDPIEEGPSYLLYTQEFYRIANERLNAGGVLVTQAGPTGLLNYTECFTAVVSTLATIFPKVEPYIVYVPSFVSLWGFGLAHTNADSAPLEPPEIDRRLTQTLLEPLRYYDGETHKGMFSLPRYLREGIKAEERIVRDDSPVFMV